MNDRFSALRAGDPEDIVCRGSKLVGSAQRRRGGAILQHGSILLARSARRPRTARRLRCRGVRRSLRMTGASRLDANASPTALDLRAPDVDRGRTSSCASALRAGASDLSQRGMDRGPMTRMPGRRTDRLGVSAKRPMRPATTWRIEFELELGSWNSETIGYNESVRSDTSAATPPPSLDSSPRIGSPHVPRPGRRSDRGREGVTAPRLP